MTREDKAVVIDELKELLGEASFFYLADSSGMNVAKINQFRRACFKQGIKIKVAKNSLIQKALEGQPDSKGYAKLFTELKGQSTLLVSDNPKAPANLLKEFRGKTATQPLLKAAYIDSDVYVGDDQLTNLTQLRSKEEVIGEVITLLQSPIKRVVGAIQSGGNTIAGLVKALEERA